jgi:hypothetical protein
MTRLTKAILLTGLFVGTTDILSAIISQAIKTGRFPSKMFNYIGGGLLGLERAMSGGNWAAFIGLFNHYAICMAYTCFFFLIFRYWRFLRFNRYLVGFLYAVFVSSTMRFVVLPLTPLPPPGPFDLMDAFMGWITLGVVLGIPIAFNAYRFYGVRDQVFGNSAATADPPASRTA